MEIALRNRLLADSGVSDIVGRRIYWIERNRKHGLPALVMNKVYPGRTYTFSGPCGLQGTAIQFDCIGQDVRETRPLFGALTAALEEEIDVEGVRFGMAFMQSDRDIAPVDVPGVGPVLAVRGIFEIWWRPL